MTIQQELAAEKAKVATITEQLGSATAATISVNAELATAKENLKNAEANLLKVQGELTVADGKIAELEKGITALKADHATAIQTLEASVEQRASLKCTANLAAVGAQPLTAPPPSAAALPATDKPKLTGRDAIMESIKQEISKSKN